MRLLTCCRLAFHAYICCHRLARLYARCLPLRHAAFIRAILFFDLRDASVDMPHTRATRHVFAMLAAAMLILMLLFADAADTLPLLPRRWRYYATCFADFRHAAATCLDCRFATSRRCQYY